MKYNQITLLIYGKDLQTLEPSINYDGVKVLKTEKVENPKYLFVTLEISPRTLAGTVRIDFKKSNKTIITKDFSLLARRKNSADRESYAQKDAIYLILPDRFSNGDPQNDVIPTLNEKRIDRKDEDKRHGGDIQGIINHLDSKQMGCEVD